MNSILQLVDSLRPDELIWLQKRATETDSDASQASKDDAQTEVGSVEEVPTDEDESEPESEEEFELSEKE